jgi:hypothetical protein
MRHRSIPTSAGECGICADLRARLVLAEERTKTSMSPDRIEALKRFRALVEDEIGRCDFQKSAIHRCPGCHAPHTGEFDHCERCRAKMIAQDGVVASLTAPSEDDDGFPWEVDGETE